MTKFHVTKEIIERLRPTPRCLFAQCNPMIEVIAQELYGLQSKVWQNDTYMNIAGVNFVLTPEMKSATISLLETGVCEPFSFEYPLQEQGVMLKKRKRVASLDSADDGF